MSFVLPLRSISRRGAKSISRPNLGLQFGSRQYIHQPAAVSSKFQGTASRSSSSFSWAAPLTLLAGLGLSSISKSSLQLEPNSPLSNEKIAISAPFSSDTSLPNQAELPKSDVNVYNLGFGTICGICSGIFIKKGAKFIAFLLGGGFVLLQYLNTQRIISVNWRALTSRYDSAISKAAGEDAVSVNKPSSGWTDSTAARIWNRSIHFLTADFPSRGTFVAGLLLGLRLG